MAKILSIIPYEFFPPKSGGALRCFHLLQALSKEHNVLLLTVQPLTDFNQNGNFFFTDNIKVISISNNKPYTSVFNSLPANIANALAYRWLKRSLYGPSNKLFLQAYLSLISILKLECPELVLYESLEALALFRDIVARHCTSIKHLYDAHNVDSKLWQQQYSVKQEPHFLTYASRAFNIEKQLHSLVNNFLCCSENDRLVLKSINNHLLEGIVIPNGVSTAARPFDNDLDKYKKRNIIFCGSLDYYPNKQGLLWFYRNVFPILNQSLPDITLTVIGVVADLNDYKELISDKNVNFAGGVPEVMPYYNQCSVCIVPLLSGSGTRLKIMEAMSMGNPVVSTSVGAEGINYTNGVDLLIADKAEIFSQSVLELLANGEKFNCIRDNARQLVEAQYDWTIIEERLNKEVNLMLT